MNRAFLNMEKQYGQKYWIGPHCNLPRFALQFHGSDNADLLTLVFGDGITDSKLFVDEELVSGATPERVSVRLQGSDGFIDIGERSCGGATCQIGEDF